MDLIAQIESQDLWVTRPSRGPDEERQRMIGMPGSKLGKESGFPYTLFTLGHNEFSPALEDPVNSIQEILTMDLRLRELRETLANYC